MWRNPEDSASRLVTMNLLCTVIILLLSAILPVSCTTTITKSDKRSPKSSVKRATNYDIYTAGSSIDVAPTPRGGLILVGGGSGGDPALAWFVRQAGYGDIVIIRASGADAYNQPLINMGANTVTSIVIKSREAAQDSELLSKIKKAEGIFFAGGDQSNYANFLTGSPLALAINKAAERGVPIGGSSAGLAILGEFYFPAYKDTVTSDQTLADPYDHRVVLEKNLLRLPHLDNLITDSHFRNRDRMGRLVTFMARILTDKWANHVRGVGLDENVAIAIETDGSAQVFSDSGHAYLLEAISKPDLCAKLLPLTFNSVTVRKLPANTKFNFSNWSKIPAKTYSLSVVSGKIIPSDGTVY
ncbi:MAG: cyanophycinase [bacterium]